MTKKEVFLTIFAFLISCMVLVVASNPNTVYAKVLGISDNIKNPQQLYRVYLAGESLGLIESKKALEDYIDQKQDELKQKYNVSKVYAPNDLDVIKEISYNEQVSTIEQIYQEIEDIKGTSSFTIDGYEVYIEGLTETDEEGEEIKYDDITLYVLDKDVFTASVEKLITAFVDEDSYRAYLEGTQAEIEENQTGIVIEKLTINNNITLQEKRIPAGGNIYQTEEALSKFLLFGTTAEQESYTVKAGDTIETISNSNQLSTVEFLIANTNFKSDQDLLYPGQEVNLGLIVPQIDVEETQRVVSRKTINKDIVYKDDPEQYVGYEQVEEEGQDGVSLVTEVLKIVNGEIQDTTPAGSTVIVPTIDRVVIRGTRQRATTSVGSDIEVPVEIGTWVWPTNSPYRITSYFSWRWGKHHDAIDISGTGYGSPIKAANNGIVVQSGYTSTNGNYIIIKHSNNYYTIYAHMAARYKKALDVVLAGDRIGTMGDTGFAQGVHLHFGVYRGYPFRGGVAFNPLSLY